MMNRHWLTLIALVAAFGAYHMPWITHEAAVFTNNAFDLAEFMSLHPSVQYESPALYTPLLLRMPIIIIALLITLSAGQLSSEKAQWLWRGFGLLVVLRLNPPAAYYSFSGASLNDQQLGNMMLAGLAGVVLLIAVNRIFTPIIYAIATTIVSIIGIYVAVAGQVNSFEILDLLQLDVGTGGGFALFVLLMILIAAHGIWRGVEAFRQINSKGQSTLHSAPSVSMK